MDNKIVTRRGYVFKYCFFYLGWILKKVEARPLPYSDPSPTEAMPDEMGIEHMVIGLSEKRVLDKLSKFLDAEKEKEIIRAFVNLKEAPDVEYICDGQGCDSRCGLAGFAHVYCKHTCDISHAANFEQVEPGKWMEKDRPTVQELEDQLKEVNEKLETTYRIIGAFVENPNPFGMEREEVL